MGKFAGAWLRHGRRVSLYMWGARAHTCKRNPHKQKACADTGFTIHGTGFEEAAIPKMVVLMQLHVYLIIDSRVYPKLCTRLVSFGNKARFGMREDGCERETERERE